MAKCVFNKHKFMTVAADTGFTTTDSKDVTHEHLIVYNICEKCYTRRLKLEMNSFGDSYSEAKKNPHILIARAKWKENAEFHPSFLVVKKWLDPINFTIYKDTFEIIDRNGKKQKINVAEQITRPKKISDIMNKLMNDESIKTYLSTKPEIIKAIDELDAAIKLVQ